MGRFPSGQRGQTVNLLQIASVVRIHLHPFRESEQIPSRDGAVWKLVGLITRRSQVQILLPQLLFYAQIAQLVEQRTENPRVTGSIPVLGTYNLEIMLHGLPCFFYTIKYDMMSLATMSACGHRHKAKKTRRRQST